MPFPDISPIAFQIGGFAVRWYALGYLIGIAIGVGYGMLLLRDKSLWANSKPPFTPAQFLDFGFWSVFGIVIGGRLGYVLLYNPGYYLTHPIEILQTWDGGMAFHGGLVGLVVAIWLFARRHGASFLSSIDILGAVSTPGIFLVRIANFINAEIYGRPTDLPWGVVFPGSDGLPRHPSQLYEALLEGLLLFLFIRYITHGRKGLHRPGLVAGLFGIGYALSRLLVEQVRLPDPHVGYLFGGWLTLGMVYTLPILLFGLLLVSIAVRRNPKMSAP